MNEATGRPHLADLSSDVFFGEPIETWPSERFAAQLTRYNIGTIAVWSAAARAYLTAHDDVVEAVGARGIFHVFKSRQPRSAFVVGAGRVRARPNALEVEADSPGRSVLAAHADQVSVDLGEGEIPVRAQILTGPERQASWTEIAAAAPGYGRYQKKTDRVIPVFVLTPRAE